jgi:hypothetical protein
MMDRKARTMMTRRQGNRANSNMVKESPNDYDYSYVLATSIHDPQRGSGTIVILVSSLSDHDLDVSLETIEGLPRGVNGELEPESFTVEAGQHAKAELKRGVSPSA